jgi:hypothetical protein
VTRTGAAALGLVSASSRLQTASARRRKHAQRSARLVPLGAGQELAGPESSTVGAAGMEVALSPLLNQLTPAERAAVLAQYEALSGDETLQAWCARNGADYGAKQRAWHRACQHLRRSSSARVA